MGVCRDCQGGGQLFFFLGGGGGLAMRGVAMRLIGGFGACFPKKILE